MKHLFPTLGLIFLAACGQKDTDAGPGGVSVGEARALDDAAAMLEQRRLPPGALGNGAPQAPAQQSSASPTPAPSPTA
ncbi:MAG TPA: hypothetical protein VLM18_01340 [Croceibacterium sp.]|nr:hypothetical protein [Croceibacterium sp.]